MSAALKTKRLGKAPGWANEIWDTIDSTNNRAIELAKLGAPEGIIVAARQQTAGRGRHGRTWTSPHDSGLYSSILVRTGADKNKVGLYTLACGVACVLAIEESCGLHVELKWVNDLVVHGKKVGGILAEMPSSNETDAQLSHASVPALILGIGINLCLETSELPPDLRSKVASLQGLSKQPTDPNILLASIAACLENELDLIAAGQEAQILTEWKRHSATLGRQIRAQSGTLRVEGTACDIDENGALIVITRDNQEIRLHAGEISIRNQDGSYS